MQIASVFSFSPFRLVVRGFSERRPCLFAMCLGLLLSQGCGIMNTSTRAPAKSKNRTAISGFPSVSLKYSTIGNQPIFNEACSAFTQVATR